MNINVIDKASSILGSQAEVARQMGVNAMTVTQWKTRGVPADHVLHLEKASGIPCWEIRPDLYPPERFKKAA